MADTPSPESRALNENLTALRTRADHADEAIGKLETRSIQVESKMDAGFARLMNKIEEQADKSKFPVIQVASICIAAMLSIAGLLLTFAGLYMSSYQETQTEHKTSITALEEADKSVLNLIRLSEDKIEDDYQAQVKALEERMFQHHLLPGHESGMSHIDGVSEDLHDLDTKFSNLDSRVDGIEKSRFDSLRGTKVENRINELSERVATLEVKINDNP